MAAKKGEQFTSRMSNTHRVKIQQSNILNALIEHVEGNREMSSTQVTAGLGLLKKALPDLTNVELSGDQDNPLAIKVMIGGDA
jgi:hypothetical protein